MSLPLSLTLLGLVLLAAVIQRVAGLGLGMLFAPIRSWARTVVTPASRRHAYRPVAASA
ncbi:hypothetical protein [Brachybacterium sp.]|uniref:hypothetical protein n=1 Tax=unclassified Brachybacterium TaxID=2623841 RepID=UPI003F93A57A